MKNKIIVILDVLISIITGIGVALSSDGVFIGAGFEYYYFQYICVIVNFVTLSLALKTRSNNLFYDNNIIRLTRVNSRSKSMMIEIKKLAFYVFCHTVLFCLSVLISERFCSNKIDVKGFVLFYLFNLLIVFLLMSIQLGIELFYSQNFAFFVVLLSFSVLLVLGDMIYEKQIIEENMNVKTILIFLNKINLVNYISIVRAKLLCSNLIYPITAIAVLLVLQTAFLFYKIRKCDLIAKE